MIRFLSPYLLLGIPVLAALVWGVFRRHRASLALRFFALAALLVALAEPVLSVRAPRDVAVFLVDRSASVRRTSDDLGVQEAMEAIMNAHRDWDFGVVAFGARAAISTPVGDPFKGLPTTLGDLDGSRFDKAVELGLAMFPADASKRLVLVSDGRLQDTDTAGITAAQLAGVPISVLAVGDAALGDVRMTALDAPDEVSAGQTFRLQAGLATRAPGPAAVALYQDDRLVYYNEAQLAEGARELTFAAQLTDAGAAEYTAVVKRDGDVFPENDAASAFVQATDRARVLVLDPRGDSAVPRLLDALGTRFDLAARLPRIAALAQYDQLVLAGVPLDDLTAADATAIELYVTNLGGGLLVIQGQDEVRGLTTSPIDSLLPVTFAVPETERDASLAMVYLLDRSGSMSELVDTRAKIRILREATAASVFLLPPDTLVGVVGFSDTYSWLYPLAPVGNADAVYQTLQELRAGGGTDLYFPLRDAVDALGAATARVKHLLLVSDGKTVSDERDFAGLAREIAARDDLSVSAIALGEEPNLSLLGEMVEAGRGELYQVTDFVSLPQVIVGITQRLGRSRFVTGDVAAVGPLWDDAANPAPSLSGYLLTYPRESAALLLGAGEDPVAATWRKGLGSVTVLNVDLAGHWSERWLNWPRLSELFGRLLATTAPRVATTTGLVPTIEVGADAATLLIEARTPAGGFANFLRLEAALLPEERPLDLTQAAPGVYRARFPVPAVGGHAVVVSEPSTGRTTRLSFAIPYAAEFAASGRDDAALRAIASATGGAVLPDESLEAAVRAAVAAAGRPLQALFIGLAILLFLLDVALRKSRFRRIALDLPDERDGKP